MAYAGFFLPDRLISGPAGASFCWQVAVAALAGVAAAGGVIAGCCR